MRSKLLPILFLICVLAACGNSSNQGQVVQSSTCQSTIPVGQTTTSDVTSSQPVVPQHMQMGPHMKMTSYRPVTSGDMARMEAIVQNAHMCFDKYRDYKRAIQDGYQIFAPHVPQDIYHFANVRNFSEAQTTFDLAHPSALLYKKEGNGYQFVGVMYSAPANFTEEQLNKRVPLSAAPWHLHVNICLPAGDTEQGQTLFAANSQFGLDGTITTAAQCSHVGGTFYDSMYGWMVHVPLFGQVGN
ncbi:MAG: hypothetical protein ACJ788_25545 [Ktedonobacteraceae bacterium]